MCNNYKQLLWDTKQKTTTAATTAAAAAVTALEIKKSNEVTWYCCWVLFTFPYKSCRKS